MLSLFVWLQPHKAIGITWNIRDPGLPQGPTSHPEKLHCTLHWEGTALPMLRTSRVIWVGPDLSRGFKQMTSRDPLQIKLLHASMMASTTRHAHTCAFRIHGVLSTEVTVTLLPWYGTLFPILFCRVLVKLCPNLSRRAHTKSHISLSYKSPTWNGTELHGSGGKHKN